MDERGPVVCGCVVLDDSMRSASGWMGKERGEAEATSCSCGKSFV